MPPSTPSKLLKNNSLLALKKPRRDLRSLCCRGFFNFDFLSRGQNAPFNPQLSRMFFNTC